MNKSILITGGTGFLGKELCKTYLNDGYQVLSLARSESKHWELDNYVKDCPKNLKHIIGDVSDKQLLEDTIECYQSDEIIVAHALKRIDVCEEHPELAIATNLIGTQNVLGAVKKFQLTKAYFPKICFISTDKAVEPSSIYGQTKSLCESLLFNYNIEAHKIVVRYGNVLNSTGSIIPVWQNQVKTLGYITMVNKPITRFIITLERAIETIKIALNTVIENPKTIIVPEIQSMRLVDLADVFMFHYNVETRFIEKRIEEKVDELLISSNERGKNGKNYFQINKFDSEFWFKDGYRSNDKRYLLDPSQLKYVVEKYLNKGT